MNKVVVLGGGVSGYAAASYARYLGLDLSFHERNSGPATRGHAFLVAQRAQDFLHLLGSDLALPGVDVAEFEQRDQNDRIEFGSKLQGWRCARRIDLLEFLAQTRGGIVPNWNCEVRDLEWNSGGECNGVYFESGEYVHGDLFLGSDGSLSPTRKALGIDAQFTPIRTREIVGSSCNKALAQAYHGKFVKFVHSELSLAFGFIPNSSEELVWFFQYDRSWCDLMGYAPAEIAAFSRQLAAFFPELVMEIVEHSDMKRAYVWNTRDFDVLPNYGRANVVLVGDAAHSVLPFASSGVSDALEDVKVVLDSFVAKRPHLPKSYYEARRAEIEEHLNFGRESQKMFLNPSFRQSRVPLIHQ